VPLISFQNQVHPTEADIVAVVEGVIGAGQSISLTYNFDLGILFSVDLPNASQAEADTVQAALIAAFPGETAGSGNEPHALLCMLDAAPQVWTAMPNALTEFRGLGNIFRCGASMLKVEQVRLVVQVLTIGSANAVLAAQWSTGAAFAFFDAGTSGPSVAINATGFAVSPWVSVPSGSRADGVAIRVIGSGGNGIASPAFGQILVEGR
jgi:hypothetical protein